MVLIDAGPLVAMFNAEDQHHAHCIAAARAIREPRFTVWPVLTEALYLLGPFGPAHEGLCDMLTEGLLRLAPLDATDIPRIRELMHTYRDLPMDLADAATVRVAERENIRRVFTLDRRHFKRYRPHRLGHFVIVP